MEKQNNNNRDFIYPIPYDQFLEYRQKQAATPSVEYNFHQFKKLKQLKKMLQETQNKINNRIRLFKKVSDNLTKKKEKEIWQESKIKQVEHYYRKSTSQINNKTVKFPEKRQFLQSFDTSTIKKKTYPKITHRALSESEAIEEQGCLPKRVEQVYEQKMQNAKQVKEWKERNKKLLMQRKTKQMRQKMQSANVIRNARSKAGEIKAECQKNKLIQVLKEKEEKFKEEIHGYEDMQEQLKKLQEDEREALILWKRTMEQV